MRKLVIFGNGLGRSLDNDHFDLSSALKSVWADNDFLSFEQKTLIASAIEGVEVVEGPEDEDQLFGTQLALIACEMLKKATNDDGLHHWLTDGAIDFPDALSSYIRAVSAHFHGYVNLDLDGRWGEFVQSLVAFVYESKSHIATLNYDGLLYSPFNEWQMIDGEKVKLCNGYDGTLLDGYTNGLGFAASNMERKYNVGDKAWYMHLHGSPLFVNDEHGFPKKQTRAQFGGEEYKGKNHIVLTHGAMKPVVISSSEVLQMYWEHLDKAIREVEEIILFGYSGRDDHLNSRIKKLRSGTPVRVIERAHPVDRSPYWKPKVGDVTIEPMADILAFRDW
ncbi:hypothetical protein [Pseudooceanicola nitratireducens]|uniref:hypothetical protein n=1 Tax=Pseudooceanicola nitratireducens TaxID=517719 RepID=UPI003C7BA847